MGNRPDVRSGTMAAGNFVTARDAVRKGGTGGTTINLYLIPSHASALDSVTLRAKPPKGDVQTVTSRESDDADGWKYYHASLRVSVKGVWVIQVTSGADTGCFRVNLA